MNINSIYLIDIRFPLASDYNTTIYTMATSGTDHVIKLWRLYCLRDLKSPKGRSRLVPSTPQVNFTIHNSLKFDNIYLISFNC